MRDNGWPSLRKKKVRQALSIAISKEEIIQQILLGWALVSPHSVSYQRVSLWYNEEGLSMFGVGTMYDKNRAKQLMKETGYGIEKNKEIQVIDKKGEKIKFNFVTITGSSIHESMACLIKQEFSDIGIEVEIKFVPETVFRKEIPFLIGYL